MAPEYNPSSQRLNQENFEFEASLMDRDLISKEKNQT